MSTSYERNIPSLFEIELPTQLATHIQHGPTWGTMVMKKSRRLDGLRSAPWPDPFNHLPSLELPRCDEAVVSSCPAHLTSFPMAKASFGMVRVEDPLPSGSQLRCSGFLSLPKPCRSRPVYVKVIFCWWRNTS